MFRFIQRVQGRSCSGCRKEQSLVWLRGTKMQAGGAYRHRESLLHHKSYAVYPNIYSVSLWNIGFMQVCDSLVETMLSKGILAHRTATVDTRCRRRKVSIL